MAAPHPPAALPAPPPAAVEMIGEALPLLVRYAELLAGPGVERGLLGPSEVGRIWERHLLNCAPVAELIPAGATVADVGSGAGLPGLVLAIVRPDVTVRLLEPMARRTAFLGEVVARLRLPNVEVDRARAEQAAGRTSQVVTTRAVAPLHRLVEWCLPLAAPTGALLAIKGAGAQAEIDAAAGMLTRHGARAEIVRLALPAGLPATTVVRVVRFGPGGVRQDARRGAPAGGRQPPRQPRERR